MSRYFKRYGSSITAKAIEVVYMRLAMRPFAGKHGWRQK
jgi:hypothetical protein